MSGVTVTAAALPAGSPTARCHHCGGAPEPGQLWGIDADGSTTADLAMVATWCCSGCFTLGAGELRRRRSLAAARARDAEPLGRARQVAAFLTKFYGADSGQVQALDEPLHTIVTKARFGLVTVEIEGQPYVVTDIAMRMLQPRELARAQGLGDDFVLTGSKSDQIGRIGNMVCPDVIEALVRAQFGLDGGRVSEAA